VLSELSGHVVARHSELSPDLSARCPRLVHADHLRELLDCQTILAKAQAALPTEPTNGGPAASKLLGQVACCGNLPVSPDGLVYPMSRGRVVQYLHLRRLEAHTRRPGQVSFNRTSTPNRC